MQVRSQHYFLQILSLLIFSLVATVLPAQPYTQMHNFDCVKDGCNPNLPGLLAQGQDGALYSTMPTQTFGSGTVVRSDVAGTFSTLYNFNGTDGFVPNSGLSLGMDGNFYGTTTNGGAQHFGTLFKVTPAGAVTVLHVFGNGTDGAYPWATPVQAPDGNIYGTTFNGMTPGTIYKFTPSGGFSIIAQAPSKTQAPLIVGTNGILYGTSQLGGTFNVGTVFQVTTAGKLTIIHSFDPTTEASTPGGPLMQAADGAFYGLTVWGGIFGQGIVYKVTAAGKLTVLHNFQSATDGTNSSTGMVQGSDKFLYGVMQGGGANNFGTLFKINTTGTIFTVLYNFDKPSGANPNPTPTLHTNGKIYGLTTTGGSPNSADGVLYSFDAGLKPFASIVVIRSGKIGASVGILGQGFNSATGVKFGTGPGTLQVQSDTYMVAKPAAGATTGTVTVLEPAGNLVTTQTFKVLPSITGFSPPSGPVGTSVVITGMSMLQTTAVTFGGVKATSITVNSDSKVTAIVPAGAKTGKVGITTKGGSATSATIFTVT